jgi:hypothetical protein
MTNPKIQIDNEVREMTAEEIEKLETERADVKALKAEEIANQATKAKAKSAVLTRLGITAEEMAALLA